MYSTPTSCRNPALSPARDQRDPNLSTAGGGIAPPFTGCLVLFCAQMASDRVELCLPGASLIPLDPPRRLLNVCALSAPQRSIEVGVCESALLQVSQP